MAEDRKLTSAARRKLKSTTFCGPGRSFPVPDCNHYSAALRLLNRANVSESTRAKIRACVNRKGTSLGCKSSNDSDEQIEELMYSETFDDSMDLIEFIQLIEQDSGFIASEDQKLRIIAQIIRLRKENTGIDTAQTDYILRSPISLLDTLLDLLEE